MNTQYEIDLVAHCIEFMSDKSNIAELFKTKGLQFRKSYSYRNLAAVFERNPQSMTVQEVTDFFRSKWNPCDVRRHMEHLTSGMLSGHDWHGAMPSFLHRYIQDKVRECSEGTLSLEDYLNIGGDILKHEYFMVATHDICESSIIESNADVIPPIGNKSVTDFIFNGVPYDLKVSTHTPKWREKAGHMTLEEKRQVALELYSGADSERLRAMAGGCKHNWGLNRMYYLVSNQDDWLNDPESVVRYLLDNINDPANYFEINVHGYYIQICLIER